MESRDGRNLDTRLKEGIPRDDVARGNGDEEGPREEEWEAETKKDEGKKNGNLRPGRTKGRRMGI